MTATVGWTVAAAPDAPEQTPPQPRPAVMRQCVICLRRGPDLGLTSDERRAIALHHSVLQIPPDAVSRSAVRWHDPQLVEHARAHMPECGCGRELVPLATTSEYRCEDRERCWVRVTEFGDMWPVDDGRPRHAVHGEPQPRAMSLVEALAAREFDGGHGEASAVPMDAGQPAPPDPPAVHGLQGSPVEDGAAAAADADELDWGFGA